MSDWQERSTGRQVPYSDDELFATGPQLTYTGENLREIAFPLGGIGTGSVSIGGRGDLVDWEIFNRPNKGFRPEHTYFVLYAREEGCEPVFRVLEGRLQPPYQGYSHGAQPYIGFGFGPPTGYGSGFLRFAESSFTGYFPFCRLNFSDETVPVAVSTEAWSPFMPLNDKDSSLPVAVFDITLTNTSEKPVDATVGLSLQNIVGWPELGGNINEWVEGDAGGCGCGCEGSGWRGIVLRTEKHAPDSPRYGTMALLTPHDDVTFELQPAEAGWFRVNELLMDDFGTTGEFSGKKECPPADAPVARLGVKVHLAPGEAVTRTLVLAWLMPNFEKYWGGGEKPVWKTYHASQWADALDVARYFLDNRERLEAGTRKFADALFSSTLPTYVLDAVSSQVGILRTPTVTRLPDGTVYGWEGCHANAGCCEGSCTHVWAYTQAMAYLFPALERGMREIDFRYDLRDEDGHMQFRMELPPGTMAGHGFHAAADGQMGNVLRVYREWQICGDDGWLRRLWPAVKKALEFAWVDWDKDRDGLLEGIHHNTLDIEYHGPETACGSMYLAALRAGEEMARHLGDDASADEYRRVFESGSRLSDERLYDGEYYFQLIPEGEEDAPYQYGPGCLCDQVLGQWHSRMYGLGDLYDPDHIRSAIASVYRHNFHDDFFSHHNPHRIYALNDDRGLIICSWPKGGRPRVPVTYAFECMIGFEYQVGVHLVYEGYLREGLTVCKAVRDRHDGVKRNPWNEFECGSHYARSMANYAYMLALSGFRYSAPRRTLYLDPVLCRDDFRCFFSIEGAWGVVKFADGGGAPKVTIEVMEGELAVERLIVGGEELAEWEMTRG